MIPIYRMKVIHVEVTNACNIACASCTRFIGHHKKTYFMDLDTVERAIISLRDFSGGIGLMGGEPTLHPQFVEICALFRKLIPDRRRREFWTNGYKWKEYHGIIKDTFDEDLIAYNDHTGPVSGVHQPLLLAAQDILDDRELMWRLIGSCWVQWRWSASITPKGGFFCEVAAAMDLLFDGPGGYPLESGWWDKTAEQFSDQVKRWCPRCSAAIPMERPSSRAEYEMVSVTNMRELQALGSPKVKQGKVRLFEGKFSEADIEKAVTAGWIPWSHRPFKQSSPETVWK